MKPSTLAMAVASRRIGYVYLIDGEVRDWGVSLLASRSVDKAKAKVRQLLTIYRPQLVITEKLTPHSRKSGRTVRVIDAVEQTAQHAEVHHIAVERVQHYANKYEEMDELAKRYPVLESWKPQKRRLWESEDRRTTIWEALALADQASL